MKFLTGFGQRPQHVLGTVGLVSFVLGALGLMYLAVYWVARAVDPDWDLTPLHQRPAVIYSLGAAAAWAGSSMSIGFLAELFIAYHGPRRRDLFDCRATRAVPPSAADAEHRLLTAT